ncbi:hypothetical protein RRG08_059835 [Elysia crispata]|uniref:Uncharacterized protein n=1 Tax=Elysia crispata TaxID=231223 RepID=A0AAE1DDW7_9GAST|nr:hypothetical protein RRG08_059835 [Elysia crispata]
MQDFHGLIEELLFDLHAQLVIAVSKNVKKFYSGCQKFALLPRGVSKYIRKPLNLSLKNKRQLYDKVQYHDGVAYYNDVLLHQHCDSKVHGCRLDRRCGKFISVRKAETFSVTAAENGRGTRYLQA